MSGREREADGGAVAERADATAGGVASAEGRLGPRAWGRLFRAVLGKQLVLLVRYPVNTAAQLLGIYLFFALIFLGGRRVAPAAITDTLDGLVIGFFLFTMTVVAYSGLAWNLTREAQWGTLEQLYVSPFGFGRVMAVKSAANVLVSLGYGAVVLALMTLTTGRVLSVDLLTLVPVVALGLCSVVGVGFVLGGLALIYKRVENVFQLVQFVFIGLIAAPTAGEPALRALPLVQSSAMLYRAMAEGVRLWAFPATDLAVLAGTAVGYLAVGYVVFGLASRRARRLGVLGHY